jgi:hypothetical protein
MSPLLHMIEHDDLQVRGRTPNICESPTRTRTLSRMMVGTFTPIGSNPGSRCKHSYNTAMVLTSRSKQFRLR